MVERRNLTVALDADTISRAKVLAAKRGTSVSRMIADLVAQIVDEERAYETAVRGAIAHLDATYHLGGRIDATRDELHER